MGLWLFCTEIGIICNESSNFKVDSVKWFQSRVNGKESKADSLLKVKQRCVNLNLFPVNKYEEALKRVFRTNVVEETYQEAALN